MQAALVIHLIALQHLDTSDNNPNLKWDFSPKNTEKVCLRALLFWECLVWSCFHLTCRQLYIDLLCVSFTFYPHRLLSLVPAPLWRCGGSSQLVNQCSYFEAFGLPECWQNRSERLCYITLAISSLYLCGIPGLHIRVASWLPSSQSILYAVGTLLWRRAGEGGAVELSKKL